MSELGYFAIFTNELIKILISSLSKIIYVWV